MYRRDFLKSLAALAAASLAALGRPGRVDAAARRGAAPAHPAGRDAASGEAPRLPAAAAFPQLAAVKGGPPDRLFAAGIAALGGMGRFVKRGGTVVVKPNIGWDVEPGKAANTSPLLVKAIVEACLAAGARRVYVLDNSCDSWKACYRSSGIEAAAREAGATVAPANAESYFQAVQVKGASTLTLTKVHELILEADTLINVPVLKSHGGAGMTCALKNLMGAVWDRGAFHLQGLDRCIAESGLALRPALNVVDASRVMLTGGPRGGDHSRYAELGMQILGTDIVAVDAAAAKAFGKDASAFRYIGVAASLGIGTDRLDGLDIRRITL